MSVFQSGVHYQNSEGKTARGRDEDHDFLGLSCASNGSVSSLARETTRQNQRKGNRDSLCTGCSRSRTGTDQKAKRTWAQGTTQLPSRRERYILVERITMRSWSMRMHWPTSRGLVTEQTRTPHRLECRDQTQGVHPPLMCPKSCSSETPELRLLSILQLSALKTAGMFARRREVR